MTQDVGFLSWLNVETLKRVPTPFFAIHVVVRCSAYGLSFARLRYMFKYNMLAVHEHVYMV